MKRVMLILLFLVGVSSLRAELPKEALHAFGDLPILHDGRIMPMESFARVQLLRFSGRETVEGRDALPWLMDLLFVPERVESNKVFLINHPEVLESLGVPQIERIPGKRKPSSRRFSIVHLLPGLDALDTLAREATTLDKDQMGPVEMELLRLHHNVFSYLELSRVFELTQRNLRVEIQSPALRETLGISSNQTEFSYLDLAGFVDQLSDQMAGLRGSADDPGTWSLNDQEVIMLTGRMFRAHQRHADLSFRLLPFYAQGEMHWGSPWDALAAEEGSENGREAVLALGRIAEGYTSGGDTTIEQDARVVEAYVLEGRAEVFRDLRFARSEATFRRAAFFQKATTLYLLAFFCALAFLVRGGQWLRRSSLGLLMGAVALHFVGLVWRIVLTGRPPVTNLYGTFLFVGLLCMGFALLIEFRQKNGFSLFMGALVGATFLLIARRFGAEGDTMKNVVAVLASNFWLSTHVLAISAGYAGVWFAGMYGHLWLVLYLMRSPEEKLTSVAKSMEGLLAFGLTFSFLGTMLGGVWADQSWGRFWGWDPKENGALLIVLWTAVIYHARVAGMIEQVGVAAGAVIGCIMVMIAWLGVNLLSVGLHSYGFSDAAAWGFFGFVAFELLFVMVTLFACWKRP